jgi:hypothetical protein
MKNCINCQCELTDSTWSADQKANYVNKCKECIKVEKRLYNKEWNKNNPGKSSEATKRCKDKLRNNDPVKARASSAYSDCRKRAIVNGMEFDLTPKFVLDLMRKSIFCPYFGCFLTFDQGMKNNALASVDRIDSSNGYTTNNIQIISYLANLMKSHASEVELVRFAEGVLRVHSLGGLRTAEKINGVAAR